MSETNNHNPQVREVREFQCYLATIAIALWGDKERRPVAVKLLKQLAEKGRE